MFGRVCFLHIGKKDRSISFQTTKTALEQPVGSFANNEFFPYTLFKRGKQRGKKPLQSQGIFIRSIPPVGHQIYAPVRVYDKTAYRKAIAVGRKILRRLFGDCSVIIAHKQINRLLPRAGVLLESHIRCRDAPVLCPAPETQHILIRGYPHYFIDAVRTYLSSRRK